MMRKHPLHPIWKHALFSDLEYVDFSNRLESALAAESDPTERRLELAMPDLTRRIDALHHDLRTAFDVEIRPVMTKVSRLERIIEDLSTGTLPLQLRVALPEVSSAASITQQATLHSEQPAANPNATNAAAQTYKLCRGIETVVDLWREWTVGLGGGPSVQFLESNNGTKWCEGKSERRFFNRRKRIVDAIVHCAAGMNDGTSEANLQTVVRRFEEKRSQMKKALIGFRKTLKVLLTKCN
ncbi:hypothetical protein BVRB_017120 [Beta vulgaris subsp. vulgaris]|uniref:Transcription activator GCR1-like domain-containing protein n=1 Tax=Beta vulgaris subsp. vulgaris TaxID=3555 RepID=A0A0J8B428_BETVV|nr:hypothetical protein BVRB_017120 [Beta vulgaris subsp. vulgaris]